MNYQLQVSKVLLVVLCIGGDTLGALLPGGGGGSSGYQYNRPGGGAAGGGGGFDFGAGGSRGRPSSTYGAPGSAGDGAGFPGRSYLTPQFGGQGGGGGGGGGGGAPGYQGGGYAFGPDAGRPQPYSFQYEVYDPPSGNDYAQRESSDGNVVQGEYRVLLPDSRTQIVKYMADDVNGYTADVQYEGQAQFSRGGAGGGPGGGYPGYQSGRPGGGAGAGPGNFGGFNAGESGSNQYLPPRK